MPIIRTKLKRKKRRCSPVVPAVLSAAFAAFVIAGVWQLCSPNIEEQEAFEFDPSIIEAYHLDASSESSEENPLSEPASSDVTAVSSQPEGAEADHAESAGSEATISGITYGVPLPEQPERVTSAYFDDAVFIGDSITTGISLYDVMSNTTVYASTGIGLTNVLTKEVATVNGVDMTIPDALRQVQPAKIYILLGANSMASDLDDIANAYSSMLNTIRSCAPNAIIYVQSVFPINEGLYQAKYNASITNALIDEFNEKLLAICGEKKILYLDLNTYFKDETGGLPAEYTTDGLHVGSAQYLDWFDYLKTHAISAS
jgi:lysophospholipase L1-like esterase